MAAFTIFHNIENDSYAAVYDSQLPTQTGIGIKENWVPVYHGEARDLIDKAQQQQKFIEERRDFYNLK